MVVRSLRKRKVASSILAGSFYFPIYIFSESYDFYYVEWSKLQFYIGSANSSLAKAMPGPIELGLRTKPDPTLIN